MIFSGNNIIEADILVGYYHTLLDAKESQTDLCIYVMHKIWVYLYTLHGLGLGQNVNNNNEVSQVHHWDFCCDVDLLGYDETFMQNNSWKQYEI